MRTIADKIKSLVQSMPAAPSLTTSFDFVKTRKGIRKELMLSRQSGNLVGVYCKALGEGMFLTAVEDIDLSSSGEVVEFRPYDMSGKILERYRIELDEIQMVCPFNMPYRHPVLRF